MSGGGAASRRRVARAPVVDGALDRQHGASDERRSARTHARLVRLRLLAEAQRKQAVHAVGRDDEIRLQRKDIAPQALEIVFERIGLRSGVDDFDRSAA